MASEIRFAAVAALALAFASSAHAATVPVTVDDNFFAPDPAQAQPGDAVLWTWAGSANHSVTSDGGESYDSGIKASGTYSRSFNVPGNFAYHCVVQSGMTGTVSVAGIIGRVLADSDATDTVTPGDDGLAGVTVTRYDALQYQMNPQTAAPLDGTVTDENGRYWFDNNPLPPAGFVTIVIDQQDGFATPSDITGLPVSSTSVHEDQDFLLEGTGTVTGTVWSDVNGNGTHDPAEVGKAGVAVSLSGKRSTTTDADGDYSFANAVPGPGTVDVTAPSGFAVIGSASRPINLADPGYTATGQDFFVRKPPPAQTGGATPGVGAGIGADIDPPGARLAGQRKQKLGSFVVVTVTADESGRATGTGSLSVPNLAKRYRLGKATKAVRAGAKAKLRLKVPKKARRAAKRALKRGKKVKAKLTVTVADAAGNLSASKRTVTLKRR